MNNFRWLSFIAPPLHLTGSEISIEGKLTHSAIHLPISYQSANLRLSCSLTPQAKYVYIMYIIHTIPS